MTQPRCFLEFACDACKIKAAAEVEDRFPNEPGYWPYHPWNYFVNILYQCKNCHYTWIVDVETGKIDYYESVNS